MQREKIQKKRQDHFERLRTEVFQYWIEEKETATLSEDREGCSHSFIPLYNNIADALKLRSRSPRARLHLEHEDYKKDKDLLQQIESR